MATVEIRGFTVIELMLFLGITGALFAALMFGANNNIAQQRYRESVVTYSSLLQDQYSEVMNTRNERENDWTCVDGTVIEQPNSGEARGTSSCVILGRAIEIAGDGTSIRTSSVIGTEPAEQSAPSDIEALVAYRPKVSDTFDRVTNPLDWGSNLVTLAGQPSMASFLILRSPASGLIRVFTSESPLPADLTTLITPSAATALITNCVHGQSGLLPTQSVTVNPKVAGADGVILKEVDSACN